RLGFTIGLADLVPERETVRKIIDIGVPTAAEQGGNSLAYVAMTSLVAMVGPVAVAAYGIGNRINTLVFLPAVGIARGTETAVGQNLGAQKPERAKRAVWLSGLMVVMTFLIMSVLAVVYAETIVSVFISGENAQEVIRMGAGYFRIIGPTYVFMGLFQIINGGFRGAGSTRASMVFSFISQWGVRIPPTFLFITAFGLGATGIWLGIAVSHVLAAAVIVVWFFYGNWATSVIDDEDEPAPEGVEPAMD
ncbi:MAG: MATE family efflux transporter, partial [Halapricum sp.]